ncbi:MAG: TonB-dependent receptor [Gemmatimonadales bacterium]
MPLPPVLLRIRLGVLLTGVGSSLSAQQLVTVVGSAHNSVGGAPIADARVGIRGRDAWTRTTNEGRFRITGAVGEWLVVARIGFRPDSVRVTNAFVELRLTPSAYSLQAITVSEPPIGNAASNREIRELDLAIRPRESSQELLRLAPGLVIAQHAGGGKAEQIFLRGFDADHGTDVAVSVDGTPVNLVSHAHGQGYADLHFLLPDVVAAIDVRKGPYDVRDGNLATAGAVAFTTRDRIDRGSVEGRGGSFGSGSGRMLLPFGGDVGHAGGYIAAGIARTDGPFLAAQDYRRSNLFAKGSVPLSPGAEAVATLSGFDSRWNASGQLPSRAVADGSVSRFGSLDPSEGGSTSRLDASLALRSRDPQQRWQIRAYATGYRFQLFSNFTFFLNDSINGDGIAQRDRRTLVGGEVSIERPQSLLGRQGSLVAIAGIRHDDAEVALADQTGRTLRHVRIASGIDEANLFVGGQQTIALGNRVRLGFGLRGDLFRAMVRDRTPGGLGVAGARSVGILSPKLNLSVAAGRGLTLFANAGSGFHSNDARDVVVAPRNAVVLPRALAGEFGARETWGRGTLAFSAWAIDLQSELVFVGDEGVTEASGRTRRVGLDLEGRVQVASWLWADADVNLSHGRFRDAPLDGNLIPLAPTVTATAGLTVRDLGPVGGALRLRHVGSRAADESGAITALGYTVTDVSGLVRLGRLNLIAAVDNLLNVTWNEAQFATTSRLRGEATPVTELNFTPGARRSFQLGIRVMR